MDHNQMSLFLLQSYHMGRLCSQSTLLHQHIFLQDTLYSLPDPVSLKRNLLGIECMD